MTRDQLLNKNLYNWTADNWDEVIAVTQERPIDQDMVEVFTDQALADFFEGGRGYRPDLDNADLLLLMLDIDPDFLNTTLGEAPTAYARDYGTNSPIRDIFVGFLLRNLEADAEAAMQSLLEQIRNGEIDENTPYR